MSIIEERTLDEVRGVITRQLLEKALAPQGDQWELYGAFDGRGEPWPVLVEYCSAIAERGVRQFVDWLETEEGIAAVAEADELAQLDGRDEMRAAFCSTNAEPEAGIAWQFPRVMRDMADAFEADLRSAGVRS